MAEVGRVLREDAGVRPGDGAVVAVSGGVDSMVLLDALCCLQESLGLHLHVAHLDHRLRPDSARDAELVRQEAAARGLGFSLGEADIPAHARQQRQSPEEAARQVRYRYLDGVRAETGSRWIALGHHASDQAETVLMHLIRGAGPAGLGAMAPVRADVYLRPLLGIDRIQIEAYARGRGLAFRQDATNADLAVPRNRIRHELIPLLEARYNPAVSAALGRAARLLRDEDAALAGIAETALETAVCDRWPGVVALAAPQLLRYHIAVVRRVLRRILQELAPRRDAGRYRDVEAVLELLRQAVDRVQDLGGGTRAQRVRDRLILRSGSPVPVCRPLRMPGATPIPERDLQILARHVPGQEWACLQPRLGGWLAAFDGEAAGAELVARSPRPGELLQPLGMAGHKKVSRLLIDAKVPRLLRPDQLVVSHADQILWVAGLSLAHPFRVRPGSGQILVLELRRQTDFAHRDPGGSA
ncbi:MAG: tRNA lysidine(34) synthetase TilS [Gemmatimonadota bacterium]